MKADKVDEEITKKTKRRKTICFLTFLLTAVVCAVIFAARAAEHSGMYWIGIGNGLATERPEDNRGFFSVDVSDFINSTGISAAEAAEDIETVPLAIGPLPSIPTLTEDELKLYGILSNSNGRVSSADIEAFSDDVHWREVVLEPGDTLKSLAEEFGISEEDLRQANGLKKKEQPNPAEVLYVPDSHDDVVATLLFVRKLQKEELTAAKKSKKLKVIEYVVKEGDTLWGISDKFKLDVDTLVGSNRKILGGNINHLKLGTTLRIPNQDGIFVKVAKGDTLDKLIEKYGSTKESAIQANSLKGEALVAGSEIFLPGGKPVAVRDVRVATKSRNTRTRRSTAARSSNRSRSRTSRSASARFRWPIRGQITSPFGWRRSPFGRRRRRVFHAGIDIRSPRGTPIRAAASGVVTHSGWLGGYGRAVVISHSGGYSTLYGHCSRLLVRNGARVSQGQTIARVGSTGRSTGNHLHFEVRVNGSPQNPRRYLR